MVGPLPQIDLYMPVAKIGQGNHVFVWSGGWSEFSTGGGNYNTSIFTGDNKNYFGLADISVAVAPEGTNTLTVQQAYGIDTKIDDGLPQFGRVMAMTSMGWAPPPGGDYSLSNDGPVTPQSGSAWYFDNNIDSPGDRTQSCYNNGDTLQVEHYSMEYNNGSALSCMLSFQFQ